MSKPPKNFPNLFALVVAMELPIPRRVHSSLVATLALIAVVSSSHVSRRRIQREREDVDLLPDFAPLRLLRPRRERLPASPVVTLPDETFLASVPVNAGGFKCEDSALVEAAGARCSLLAKSVGPLGCQRVLSDLAAERGKSLDGVPVAFRNRRVADACPESCGLCELCAPGCARWFIGNGWCEPDCNVKACQWDGGDCWETDCVVGPWGDYSKCSISCDPHAPHGKGGYQTRVRQVKTKNSPGGKPCPPLEDKTYGCNAHVACPVECEVSAWGDWSPCSAECGVGESIRTRQVVRPPANGALHCPELKQKRPCFLKECSSPCRVSEWGEWSLCSAECGGGSQIRQRSILMSPVGTDSFCPPLFEERVCNTQPCIEPRIDCVFSDWSDWTSCSASCGGGLMNRTRTIMDFETCSTVNSTLLIDIRECNTFDCVVDCKMGEWSEWTNCSSKCGEGKQSRYRDVLEWPSPKGLPCEDLEQHKRCYSGSCAVNCETSAWTEWSACTVATGDCGPGSRMRSRAVITAPANGGHTCPELVEFEECSKTCEDKCHLSSHEFSPWTTCEDECQTEGVVIPKKRRHAMVAFWSEHCSSAETEEFAPCPNTCGERQTWV
eukprot:Gregarina_sp_Poly_1__11397@NODE_96_length_14647_cov_152_270302_g83_i0_p1_GENE_NODE_96_length_14647_cov_152_270302_g83_i0NODE_96_length_14647_cov_152_270302_g83_i0_p1_ORF_typecomplete_len610_score56_79TSP_1/PF00090_19/1_8e04TSP_1/PF00090_19/1_6e08TSP_1/PF00090_19/2_4e12TSP_1/PF00090_19/7_5e13TSP_1/PF00090_19/3_3e09TSP_1/PF00090_19/8_7e08TSP_1/PF00090_19/2_4e07TSP_1/PF00090_19/13TSP_1/PF00090_19/1_4e02Notch/PF00066_17/1_6e09Notch/PF00066_17/1_8e04Notch/PF00066_17/9_8e03Notch/PF00066_17/1_3e03Notch